MRGPGPTGREVHSGAEAAAAPPTPQPGAITRGLLVLLACTVALAVGLGVGWFRAARRAPDIDRLDQTARVHLVERLVRQSPGIYIPAYFEPRLGYVLRPGAELSAWGTTFHANEIGFRSGPVAKPTGAFRVVCVGDSWTFGMGVAEREAYPARLAALAAAAPGRVEVWNLALPGYNTFNEVAALEYFLDRLRPDAVVLTPTMNDIDSTASVLPNGSLATLGTAFDAFGEPHPRNYTVRLIDSFEYLRRWRLVMSEIRRLESRLEQSRTPLFLFFTGRWREPFAHRLVADAGIRAPYTVLPHELTDPEWLLPEHGHPTAAAYERHATIVYRLVAGTLGWPPPPGASDPLVERAHVYQGAPPADWDAATAPMLADMSARQLDEELLPSPTARGCLGGLDCRRGLLRRAGTVIVRRRAGAKVVVVELRPLGEGWGTDPMKVVAEIPSAAGGSRAQGVLSAGATRLELPLPSDIPDGRAMDVVVIAERAIAERSGLLGRSAWVISVRQR